jgi:hypothetical protein
MSKVELTGLMAAIIWNSGACNSKNPEEEAVEVARKILREMDAYSSSDDLRALGL